MVRTHGCWCKRRSSSKDIADASTSTGGGDGARQNSKSKLIDAQHFECPVCLGPMMGKICTCPSGHALCMDTCFEKLPAPKQCPICRVGLPSRPARGLVIEQMVAAIRWECKFGCGLEIKGADMQSHTARCKYRLVTCSACKQQVPLHDILKHFKDNSSNHFLCTPPVKDATGTRIWSWTNNTYWKLKVHREKYNGFELHLLVDSEDIILIRMRYSSNGKEKVLFEAFHAHRERVCTFCLGCEDGCPRFSFTFKSACISESGLTKGWLFDPTEAANYSFPYSLCEGASPDGKFIPVAVSISDV